MNLHQNKRHFFFKKVECWWKSVYPFAPNAHVIYIVRRTKSSYISRCMSFNLRFIYVYFKISPATKLRPQKRRVVSTARMQCAITNTVESIQLIPCKIQACNRACTQSNFTCTLLGRKKTCTSFLWQLGWQLKNACAISTERESLFQSECPVRE